MWLVFPVLHRTERQPGFEELTMCGIAGVVGERDDSRIDFALIRRMCQTMIHRGPNDEGVFVKSGAGLGMRRLSVIDLSGGQQPVFNEDRSIWVVFNGEIYNFRELRNDLEKRGHRFYTQSDTEVIVHLYEDLGAECVKRLRGMFAFAVFDERRRSLLLARDRLGKKPLHYAFANGRLYFGSEMKAILAVAPDVATISSEALLQYFYFGYILDPATVFRPIQKLAPGNLLEFEDGEVRLCQYWDLPEYGTYSPNSEEECLDELEEKLTEAVRMRLVSDVPLGALLSGGTDSSTIVGLMARCSTARVKTFSIGFRDTDFDETPYARMVAERFGTEHHELILEPSVVEMTQKLASSLEEPFGDSSILPTYYVCTLAKQFVTVVLSGDGGDEAFGGYDRYRVHLQERLRYRVPQWAGRFYRERVYDRVPFRTPGRNLAYSVSLPWPERYIESLSLLPYQRNFQILGRDFVSEFSNVTEPRDVFREYLRGAPANDPMGRILYLDTKTYLPGDILTKLDRMSMAVSLEARVPMLDHVFLEWVTSLAPRWKMNQRGQKYILTRLAERVGVPSEVLHRPKQGFALPLVHWMRNELRELVLDLLLDRRTLQRGYFNEHGVRHFLNDFFSGHTNDPLPIWRLMMFELWYRNFLAQLTPTATVEPERALDMPPGLE
jgi:asparagine synthase (glutamine-hydrolysing)